jgi:hypothetical protein
MLASIIQTNPLQKGAWGMGDPFSVEADWIRARESLVTQLTTV